MTSADIRNSKKLTCPYFWYFYRNLNSIAFSSISFGMVPNLTFSGSNFYSENNKNYHKILQITVKCSKTGSPMRKNVNLYAC